MSNFEYSWDARFSLSDEGGSSGNEVDSQRGKKFKQFIWWVFKHLGKGNRRVIPLCVLWKIKEYFPEPDADYVNYSGGKKD